MHPTARRRSVGLTLVVAALVLNCGLVNPLEHLQAGRDAEAVFLAAGDGEASGAEGGIFEDSARVDADDGPCSKPPWPNCGVIVVATPQDPGDAIFGLSSGEVHYSDTATGELFTTTCTSAACTAPTRIVGGEDMPRRMAYVPGSLFWTTRTAIRRVRIDGVDAAPAPVDTIDAIEGAAEITASYPNAFWTDDKGARGWPLQGGLVTLSSSPSSSPSFSSRNVMFVSEGEVKVREWSITDFGALTAVPGSSGIVRAGWSVVMGNYFEGVFGVIGALPQATGTRLLLVDKVDDAGAPLLLADEPHTIRSFGASNTSIYWTTSAGELRRRAKDAPSVTTLLRGLSGDTSIHAGAEKASVIVTDRGLNQIVFYTPR